eukprot:723993-Alexandrium_andersonii.AAC.1
MGFGGSCVEQQALLAFQAVHAWYVLKIAHFEVPVRFGRARLLCVLFLRGLRHCPMRFRWPLPAELFDVAGVRVNTVAISAARPACVQGCGQGRRRAPWPRPVG